MINLIVGKKGMGKTKMLIDLVNEAVSTHSGNVVCIEKGIKLTYDISHKARLIDIAKYPVSDYPSLCGFICGILSSNYDITSVNIDSITKICNNDLSGLGTFLNAIDELKLDIDFNITVSADISEVSDDVKKYIK